MDPTNLRPDQLVTNVCLKATLSTMGLVDDSSVERLIGVYKIVHSWGDAKRTWESIHSVLLCYNVIMD